jgi:hypothetical protein
VDLVSKAICLLRRMSKNFMGCKMLLEQGGLPFGAATDLLRQVLLVTLASTLSALSLHFTDEDGKAQRREAFGQSHSMGKEHTGKKFG